MEGFRPEQYTRPKWSAFDDTKTVTAQPSPVPAAQARQPLPSPSASPSSVSASASVTYPDTGTYASRASSWQEGLAAQIHRWEAGSEHEREIPVEIRAGQITYAFGALTQAMLTMGWGLIVPFDEEKLYELHHALPEWVQLCYRHLEYKPGFVVLGVKLLR